MPGGRVRDECLVRKYHRVRGYEVSFAYRFIGNRYPKRLAAVCAHLYNFAPPPPL